LRTFVGVTDNDWFEFLSSLPDVDEVNFCQPSAGRLSREMMRGLAFCYRQSCMEPLWFSVNNIAAIQRRITKGLQDFCKWYTFAWAVTTGPSTGIDVIAPGRQDRILFSGAPTSVWHRPILYRVRPFDVRLSVRQMTIGF